MNRRQFEQRKAEIEELAATRGLQHLSFAEKIETLAPKSESDQDEIGEFLKRGPCTDEVPVLLDDKPGLMMD